MDKLGKLGEDARKQIDRLQSTANKPLDALNNAADAAIKAKNDAQRRVNEIKQLADNVRNTKKKVIDIGKRLQSAFGFVSSNMSAELKNKGFTKQIGTAEVFIRDASKSFEKVLFSNDTGLELLFDYNAMTDSLGNVFAPPPMVSFSKSKRIERTILDGVQGEVVEQYGHKPWEITVQGIIIDMDNHEYPGDRIRKLVRCFDYNGIWQVESSIFQDHKIKSVYWEDISTTGVQGFEDTWQFTLKGYSIRPVEAFLNQK